MLFRDLAVRTAHGKPSCAIVFGSSTAGGAYHPALSDYTIFVENQAQAFLGGPPLVKMATGEVIGAEELGGAKVHATTTGLADQIASDEYVIFLVDLWFDLRILQTGELTNEDSMQSAKPASGWRLFTYAKCRSPRQSTPWSLATPSRTCCRW